MDGYRRAAHPLQARAVWGNRFVLVKPQPLKYSAVRQRRWSDRLRDQ
jgi:hypothetical protein